MLPVINGIQQENDLFSNPVVDSHEPETINQYGQTYNVYNREILYQEVWDAPVTEVAKRYKVSDVTIHKICKALEIPTPPAGYWAKKRAGKSVTIVSLPKNDKISQKVGVQTGLTYNTKDKLEILAFLNEEDKFIILSVASQLLLPDEKTRMHEKIIAHRKVITEWKKKLKEYDNKGWNRRNLESPPYLANDIADETIPRACRIIDALIKAMEPLGGSLTNDLGFCINGETVRISFSESKDKVSHIPTKDENMQLLKYEENRKRNSWAPKPQIRIYDYIYNGKLRIFVQNRKEFRDCKLYSLEERIGDIMIEIYESSEDLRKKREVREETERKKKEEERRKEEFLKLYNAEVDSTISLINCSEDYEIACKIRLYISGVEASGSLDEKTKKWIDWAKDKADWYDPIIAKEDKFFGKRKHGKGTDSKKLENKRYWE